MVKLSSFKAHAIVNSRSLLLGNTVPFPGCPIKDLGHDGWSIQEPTYNYVQIMIDFKFILPYLI
ncbi:MAG: hypothetical protein C4581_01595 [Nitrospiraceae bacterium]|nr:MAG: hypothetical protein C4581_01595 [Nitrospiraceae bacterium]